MTYRVLFLALASASLTAAEKWTIDDVLFQERVAGIALSRDGKSVAYAKSVMDAEKGEAVSNLFLRRLDGTEAVQLTRGKDNCTSPEFSPDSQRLAFLSNRKPGEAPAAGDAAAEDASLSEQKTKERKDTSQVVDDEKRRIPGPALSLRDQGGESDAPDY
jgi:dipeptidyl aminopeptidase/acylaminoacyl peptidase